jgi:hypothetical protein
MLVALGLMAACGASESTVVDSSTAPDSTTSTVTTSPSSLNAGTTATAVPLVLDESQPICGGGDAPGWVTGADSEFDGVADPTGRIFFGQFLREDDVVAQVVGPLFAIDPDGSDLAQVLDCHVARPRVSPDGTRLAFSIRMDDGAWQIATSSVDGTDLRVITSGSGFAETPDWSPDGTWLIYSYMSCPSENWKACVDDGEGWALWRMDSDGSDRQILTETGNLDWEPRLSPDGASVVFTRQDFGASSDGRLQIVVRELATGEERAVEHPELTLEHPEWSPDGKWILYNTMDPDCRACDTVQRIPADDLQADPDLLFPAPPGGMKPAYAPDGSGIVFGCGIEVCVMGPNGEDPTVLIGIEGELVNHFAWGASG